VKSAALGTVLLVAGCASSPFEAHLAALEEPVRLCAQWYEALDRAVDAAGVRDAQYPRVPGFPYLRVSRYLASLRQQAGASDAAMRTFSERLLDLDLESRRFEIQNLPEWTGSREAAVKRTADCGQLLREADLAKATARRELLGRVAVPDDDAPAPPTASFAAPRKAEGPRVRFAPPPASLPRSTVAGMLALARLDPLHQPSLSDRAFQQVAALYAPSFELVVASDYDRFGELRWRRRQATPQVDGAEPVVYVQPAYTRFGERTLLQIVYTMWFPASSSSTNPAPEGLVWRVTLSPEGEPLVYDSMHACGCQHRFFATAGAAEGERPLVRLSGEHLVEGVSLVRGNDSLVRYGLRPYDELRSAATMEGGRRSMFGPDGMIAGSATPGAARQWGRQAMASGQSHFDDADLIEKRFNLRLP
jgi:hypothetical protein